MSLTQTALLLLFCGLTSLTPVLDPFQLSWFLHWWTVKSIWMDWKCLICRPLVFLYQTTVEDVASCTLFNKKSLYNIFQNKPLSLLFIKRANICWWKLRRLKTPGRVHWACAVTRLFMGLRKISQTLTEAYTHWFFHISLRFTSQIKMQIQNRFGVISKSSTSLLFIPFRTACRILHISTLKKNVFNKYKNVTGQRLFDSFTTIEWRKVKHGSLTLFFF